MQFAFRYERSRGAASNAAFPHTCAKQFANWLLQPFFYAAPERFAAVPISGQSSHSEAPPRWPPAIAEARTTIFRAALATRLAVLSCAVVFRRTRPFRGR